MYFFLSRNEGCNDYSYSTAGILNLSPIEVMKVKSMKCQINLNFMWIGTLINAIFVNMNDDFQLRCYCTLHGFKENVNDNFIALASKADPLSAFREIHDIKNKLLTETSDCGGLQDVCETIPDLLLLKHDELHRKKCVDILQRGHVQTACKPPQSDVVKRTVPHVFVCFRGCCG